MRETKYKELASTHFRLKEWGYWKSKCEGYGLGFPTKSIIISAVEGSRSTAPIYPPDNQYAEEVNDIIIVLRERHPEWEKVIKLEYVDPGTQSDKAIKLKLTRSSYLQILTSGKIWVDARLCSNDEFFYNRAKFA